MSTPQSQTPSPLILIADDDAFTRLMLRQFLESEGYSIVEARDGHECLAAYPCYSFDIVLLDAMMPGMNGFDCCGKLQCLPNSKHTPVLMITGLEDQVSVDRAFEVGAADYVTKPIHWAVLRQRVRRLIEKSQLYRTLEAVNQELEEANGKLQHLAAIDSLTQVFNRRSFDEYLKREWLQTMHEQAPLSLILCDVDFFKRYNDTYGHLAGDDCLRAVASTLSKVVQTPTALVARYGGEEFAVVLPNTDALGATLIAQRIRSEVQALQIAHANSEVSEWVSLSQGIASLVPNSSLMVETLISVADRGLYRAKAEGRDRIIVES
jgi:diguanylate cyclase (GGDEF)-like protein